MNCAVYIRVSTDKEEQKASLTNQKELFFNFIANKGWSIYNVYIDVESGTSDKREGLQQLIEDANKRKFDIILAKELSRLARNGGLSYKIRDLAERNHIHIITLDNAINTLEGNSGMFGLYAWMYEQESQRTSERIKAALNSRARKGLFKGSIPPYGYELKDGKLFIRDDQTPSIVRRIFKEYLQGKGFDAIARALYNEGYPTPAELAEKTNAGDKWHGSSIRSILTNPHYTGDLVQGRQATRSVTSKVRYNFEYEQFTIVRETHEPIISNEDFEAVQVLIASRKRERPYEEKHLFTNTLRCADCGKGMHFKKNRRGYICGSYNKHGEKACSDHHVVESDLTLAVLKDIESLITEIEDQSLLNKLEAKIKKQFVHIEKQLQSMEREIKNIQNQKTKLIQLLASEVITQDDYRDVVKQNEDKLKQLIQTKADLSQKLLSKNNNEQLDKLKKELTRIKKFETLTPELLHRLIDRIEIQADGTARILYRFSLPSAII